jgi:hypothetical protein
LWFTISEIKNDNHSPVAQSVERVAVNHLVGGSSPSRGARIEKRPEIDRAFFSSKIDS